MLSDCHNNKHIWDLNYEKESKSERLCISCGHIFPSEDKEIGSIDNAISWPNTSIYFSPQKPISPGGLSKGKIIRRS